ncbi:hypothetical protein KP509_14G067500 [Ceratopteris richardii]|uniref:K Homology domain-containing protein n=1 Tax=Ceratopteris richardii TaxID=49495 RepID=A0A8T2T8V6_CERRI|nr:hypothetical protein KP509_14G067500 [Ceratopteris richardii]
MDSSPSTSDTTKSASPMARQLIDHTTENGNEATSLLRFLISNATAGSVIGKGGATISELQSKSGAKIQLSRNHEYFPGTTDRVVHLSGSTYQIVAAFKLILSKIQDETEDLEPKANQVRLVIPHLFCGAIIGKGGATIRTLMEESGAVIKLSSLERTAANLQDRIVSITGSFDAQLHAGTLIAKKLSEDGNYIQYASGFMRTGMAPQGVHQGMLQGSFPIAPSIVPFPYGPVAYNDYHTKGMVAPYMGMPPAPFHLQLPVYPGNAPNTVIPVPDECIGAILGRGGRTILEIQQSTGVHIRISDRGDFVPGTNHRYMNFFLSQLNKPPWAFRIY